MKGRSAKFIAKSYTECFMVLSVSLSRLIRVPTFAALAVPLLLGACAATVQEDTLAQRTSVAIARPVGSFTISDRSEEAGGRINYTARAKDGAVYQCYLMSPSGFVKTMSFGMAPDSDALCTLMSHGSGGAAAEPRHAGPCNALLKAAGRC